MGDGSYGGVRKLAGEKWTDSTNIQIASGLYLYPNPSSPKNVERSQSAGTKALEFEVATFEAFVSFLRGGRL